MQWAARAFGGVDELPALIDRHGCRNLERDMLAAFHRIDGDRRVQFPRRTVVYQIDVVALAHLFPVLLAGVCGRLGQSGSGQYPLRPLDGPRTYVAQRDDLNALQMREALDGHRTRMPSPTNATRTVGIGSQRNCSTSVCPFSRRGSANTSVPFLTLGALPSLRAGRAMVQHVNRTASQHLIRFSMNAEN